MILNNRTKQIIKTGIEDYKFFKRVLVNEILEKKDKLNNYGLIKYLHDFVLTKFKDVIVTDIVGREDDEGYFRFTYNSITCSVYYEIDSEIIVDNTFIIYDKERGEYVCEGWSTPNDYEKALNMNNEEILKGAIYDLRHYEETGESERYNQQVQDIIEFLKENW